MQGQEDFVRNYAAKRAAQMERARALRDQREQQRGGASAVGGAPSGGYQQQQYQAPPSQREAPQRSAPPPALQEPPRRGHDYPPPVQSHHQPPPQQHYHQPPPPQQQHFHQPPSQQHSSYAPPAAAASRRPDAGYPTASRAPAPSQGPPPSAGNAVAVRESDFQRAVALGVISGEQARQLWTVVSSGAGAAPAPSTSASYDPNMYAPASAPASDARRQQQLKQQQQQPVRQSVSSSNRRPEWNADDDDVHRDDSYDHYEPPARATGSGPTPGRTSRPQISPQQQQPQRGEWVADYDEPTDGGFGAPPPVPGRRVPKVASRRDDATTPRRVEDIDSMPVGRGGGGAAKADPYADAYPTEAPASNGPRKSTLAPGAASRIAKGRRAGAPSSSVPDEPPPPPPPPADELEFMERQKAEAAARFAAEVQEAEEAAGNEPMEDCRVCGRRFRASIVDRHEVACQKASKKRKTFNMKEQMLGDVAQEAKQLARNAKVERKPVEKPAGKMPKWKVQHEQFQAAMQAVGGTRKSGGGGGGFVPPPAAPDDRVPCPHCNRKFAEDTAARHIPHCKTTVNKPRAVGARR